MSAKSKKTVTKKTAISSTSKAIETVVAAAALTLGKDAVASALRPEATVAQALDPESLGASLEASIEKQAEAALEKQAAENDALAAKDADSQPEGKLAEILSSEEELAAAPNGDPILVADASEALGVKSDQPMKLADASSASTSATPEAEAGIVDGAAEAGLSGMQIAAIGIGAVVIGAAAASGGGGDDGGSSSAAPAPAPAPEPAPAATSGGFAAKGILSGAKVFYDFNGNGIYDATDPSGITKADGSYTIDLTAAQKLKVESGLNDLGKALKLIVTGGNDVTNGTAFTGTLVSDAPTDTTKPGEVTIFSTLKASGMSSSQLSQLLGGRDLDSLSASDFDTAGDASEALALKLYSMVQSKLDALGTAGDDGDAAIAAFSSLTNALEQLSEDGDLSTLLAGLSASELDSALGPIIDKSIEMYNAGYSTSEIEMITQSYAEALDTAGVFNDMSDGAVGDDGVNYTTAFANAEAAADTAQTNVDSTSDADLALAEKYGVSIHYTGGVADYFIISEEDAASFIDQGLSDPFGASTLDAVLQVEGTLLGTKDNPLTFAELSNLGIDGIFDGTTGPGASGIAGDGTTPEYLHLTGNLTNQTIDEAFISHIGDINGDLPVYVDGTTYHIDNKAGNLADLGTLGDIGDTDWDNFTHTDFGT